MKKYLTIAYAIGVIILLSYAVNNVSQPSDIMVFIGLIEIAICIALLNQIYILNKTTWNPKQSSKQ